MSSSPSPKGDLVAAGCKWIGEIRWCLMASAAMMATTTYRAVMNPPGWLYAFAASYDWFSALTRVALATSLLLVVMLSSEVFYRTRARMAVLALVAVSHFVCFVSAFLVTVSPEDPVGGSAFILLIFAAAIAILFAVAHIIEAIWKLVHPDAKV